MAGAALPAAAGTVAPTASAGSTGSATATARLIRTAQVTVEVSGQLNVAVAQVKQVAKRYGGQVASETTGLGDQAAQPSSTSSPDAASGSTGPGTSVQRGESLGVLRVPEPKLDEALAALTDSPGLPGGKVLSQTSSSQDVTGDIADLGSRVASQRASLERVRALMTRATSLQDVVTLESELSRRQADLEALEARLATLSDQADLSTLTVLLRTPGVAPAQPDTGFLAGLRSGWHALQASTTAVLTVLGALLPVAVLAVVIGWPVLRYLRRRAGRRVAATPPAPGWPYGHTPGSGPGGTGPAGGSVGPAGGSAGQAGSDAGSTPSDQTLTPAG